MIPAQNQKMDRSAWMTLSVLSCLGLVTLYGETMVLPAIPDFISDFNITYNTSSWILTAFLIAGAVMTPIAGKLSDIYGKKRVLLTVLAIYSGGLLIAGFANSIEIMIAARVAQGVGFSMFPIAFGIVREVLPIQKLAMGQTIFGSTFSGGAVVGLLVGGIIIQNYGWHFTFFSVFPVAVIIGLLILKLVRTSPPVFNMPGKVEGNPNKSLDLKGTVALASTVTFFLAGISVLEGSISESVIGLDIIGLFAVAVISLGLFMVIEKKTSVPLIDFKLITHRMLLPTTIILMLVGLCTFMVYQTIPILIRSPKPFGFGGDAIVTAGVQLPFMIVLLIGTIGSGLVLNRLGNLRLTVVGTSLSMIGFFSLLVFHQSELMVTITLSIIAAGLSLAFTGGFNIVLVSAPVQSTGIALGMTLLLNLIGQSVGPTVAAIFQQTYQGSIEGVGRFPTAEAYNMIFLTAAIISLTSVVLALTLSRRKVAPIPAGSGHTMPTSS
ncbi:MAG: MFS transporter [Thaumarchaeota archaeon]|nr:MFS transporter [Nitrososphaerota archaeon]